MKTVRSRESGQGRRHSHKNFEKSLADVKCHFDYWGHIDLSMKLGPTYDWKQRTTLDKTKFLLNAPSKQLHIAFCLQLKHGNKNGNEWVNPRLIWGTIHSTLASPLLLRSTKIKYCQFLSGQNGKKDSRKSSQLTTRQDVNLYIKRLLFMNMTWGSRARKRKGKLDS